MEHWYFITYRTQEPRQFGPFENEDDAADALHWLRENLGFHPSETFQWIVPVLE